MCSKGALLGNLTAAAGGSGDEDRRPGAAELGRKAVSRAATSISPPGDALKRLLLETCRVDAF
jgi:hypothetical protein